MAIPIPGARHAEYYDENVGAVVVDVSDEENEQARAAVNVTEVVLRRRPVCQLSLTKVMKPAKVGKCSLCISCHIYFVKNSI